MSNKTETELAAKRAANQGFGDGLAKAFELVVTPLVFVLIGMGLDHVLSTKPLFTVAFALFGVVGVFLREWFAYDAKMKEHERAAAWNKH